MQDIIFKGVKCLFIKVRIHVHIYKMVLNFSVFLSSLVSVSLFAEQPPKRPTCVVKVTKTIVVNGTLDGKGCVYTWRGAGYPKNCNSPKEISENQPAMFELKPGANLKNLHMECALDGIHTSQNNIIENIVNRDVEEDAITIGNNITVRNSKFYFCNDKCLQMNKAKNVRIEGNYFYSANTAVLANYGQNIVVKNNYFKEIKKTAIRAVTRVGVRSDITASYNQIVNAQCGLRSETGSQVINGAGNVFKNVETKTCK